MHQELVVHQWDCERGIECASRWEIEIECTVRTKEKCSSHLKLISVQLSLDRNGLKRSSSLQNSFSVSCHLLTQNFQGQWMQWVSFLSKWQNQMNGLTLQARVRPDKCLPCRPRCNDFYWYWTTDHKTAKMLKKHRKNCECCPVSQSIVRYQRLSGIQVLNCKNCNQCLNCHKSAGLF